MSQYWGPPAMTGFPCGVVNSETPSALSFQQIINFSSSFTPQHRFPWWPVVQEAGAPVFACLSPDLGAAGLPCARPSLTNPRESKKSALFFFLKSTLSPLGYLIQCRGFCCWWWFYSSQICTKLASSCFSYSSQDSPLNSLPDYPTEIRACWPAPCTPSLTEHFLQGPH